MQRLFCKSCQRDVDHYTVGDVAKCMRCDTARQALTLEPEYENARTAYHTMMNAWCRWGIEHYVHKWARSNEWHIDGTGLTQHPGVFKTKKAAVEQVEKSVPQILDRLRSEMLELEGRYLKEVEGA